mmetsp:Transcript_17878/g.52101  ORF Transcript_17878/g.52101 Transcript_17878/m.52101 type:complete len:201 (+) Transcript_17878:907-1509(+)
MDSMAVTMKRKASRAISSPSTTPGMRSTCSKWPSSLALMLDAAVLAASRRGPTERFVVRMSFSRMAANWRMRMSRDCTASSLSPPASSAAPSSSSSSSASVAPAAAALAAAFSAVAATKTSASRSSTSSRPRRSQTHWQVRVITTDAPWRPDDRAASSDASMSAPRQATQTCRAAAAGPPSFWSAWEEATAPAAPPADAT